MKEETLMKSVTLIALIAVVLLLHPTLTAADESITGAEHWVQSVSSADGKPLKLYVWEKRLKAGDPSAFARSGKSAVTYSLMDYLAAQGFDVFIVDYQNYGRSDHHPCGLCVTTQVAATMQHPEKVRRLVLYAPPVWSAPKRPGAERGVPDGHAWQCAWSV